MFSKSAEIDDFFLSNLPSSTIAKVNMLRASGVITLPAPCAIDMDVEFLKLDMHLKTLSAAFPVKPRYRNPLGFMQGGMIAAAIDNTIGPLSYIVAPPSITASLNVHYHQPIDKAVKRIIVNAKLLSCGTADANFNAEVCDGNGQIFARAEAFQVLIDNQKAEAT